METFKIIVWRNLVGIFVAIVLLCMLFSQCSEKRRLQTNLSAITTENITYKNKIGTVTTQNANLLLTNSELKKNILDKNDTIKLLAKGFYRISTITTVKTNTRIDTIQIPFKVPVPCNFVREGSEFKEWYSLKWKADSLGISINDLAIPNNQTIITGFKRKWFLGKITAVTEVTNSNPLIHNQGVRSFETVVPKKWYENKLIWLTAGLITGAILLK